MAIAVVDNSSPTSGDWNDEAWDAYNATVAALLIEHDSAGAHNLTGYMAKTLFDAHTILYATTDDTPVALTVAASRIVGRKSAGNIVALTAAQVLTILGLEADLANLTSAEVDQIEAIGATTISEAQWGYLGACGAGGGQLLAALTADESTQLEAIGATTISAVQWGYVGALTTVPIGGDGTAGRILKGIRLDIENGSNANTLKCTTVDRWNGDVIAVTDNIAKDATTGDFSLSVDGQTLKIEASGLTGNAIYSHGIIYANLSGAVLLPLCQVINNDIVVTLRVANTTQDMTVLVDTGGIYLEIFYITSA